MSQNKTLTFLRGASMARKSGTEDLTRLLPNSEILVATLQGVLPGIDLSNRIIIRWGSTYKEVEDVENSIVYNKRESTKLAINKKEARETLIKSGISVPRSVSPSSSSISYPVIARPRKHSLGSNFVVLHTLEQLKAHYYRNIHEWYYSEYVDKVSEFRVHVAHGKILGIIERPKTDGYIWSAAHNKINYKVLNSNEWDLRVVRLAIKATKAIGLDFAGLDVIVDSGGNPYVLELNTIPDISSEVGPTMMAKYAAYFKHLGSSDTRIEHFEVESEDTRAYAWALEPKKTLTLLLGEHKTPKTIKYLWPKLRFKEKAAVVGDKRHGIYPPIDESNRIFIRWRSDYPTEEIPQSITYNTLDAVLRNEAKGDTRIKLDQSGVKVPRILTLESQYILYPVIARPQHHGLGRDFVVLNNKEEFLSHCSKHQEQGWYYAEYVNKVNEYRLNIAHGKVLNVLKKAPKEGLAWNNYTEDNPSVHLPNEDVPLRVIKEAIKAFHVSGLDLAGVDVIETKCGEPYVLELNVSPGLMSVPESLDMFAGYLEWLHKFDDYAPHYKIYSNNKLDYFWSFNDK